MPLSEPFSEALMTSESWQKLESLFFDALEIEPTGRAAWLDQACGGDVALRNEVEAVLAAHTTGGRTGVLDQLIFSDDAADDTVTAMAGERIGAWRIEERIGRGGMGDVYRGVRDDASYSQEVAIKLVRPGFATGELSRRFRVERQILAWLEHPNIATLLDGGVSPDGQPYIVMQYVRGLPITEWADANGLDARRRLELFRTVCEAVQFAHTNLVVHRDLKPSNILVTEDGQVRLLDFGIAKLLDPRGIDTGVTQDLRMLTPERAAPEQLVGGAITTATDVHALGVLLYELLTGRLPFRAESPVELQRLITETEPPRPSEYAAQAKGDLDAIVQKTLRKEPHRRYASAGQLADEITRFLHGEPVLARPDSLGYRARKFIARNRLAVAAASTFVILLAGSATVAAWQSRERAIALDRMQLERDKAKRLADFLSGVFRINDPGQSRGREITARELLDRGAADIRTELADQPLVLAEMRMAIGQAYRTLGIMQPADSLLGLALAQRRELLPPDDPDLAFSLEQMMRTRAAQSRFREALDLGREATAIRQRVDGARSVALAEDLDIMGRIYVDLNVLDTAKMHFERALDIQTAAFGAVDRSVAITLRNLGNIRLWQDSGEAAALYFRQAIDVAKRATSEDDPFVFEMLEDYALSHQAIGQLDSAEAIHRYLLGARERVFGPDHPNTSYSYFNLARVLSWEHRYDEAAPLFENALRIRRQAYGEDNYSLYPVLNSYGIMRGQMGEFDKSVVLLKHAHEIAVASMGPTHLSAMDAAENLSIMYGAWGHWDDSMRWLQTAIEHGYRNLKRLEAAPFDRIPGDPRLERLRARMRERPAQQ
jgi:eukaryotic-like serine/threonine-protein kinase